MISNRLKFVTNITSKLVVIIVVSVSISVDILGWVCIEYGKFISSCDLLGFWIGKDVVFGG